MAAEDLDIELTIRQYIVDNFLLGEDDGLEADASLVGEGVVDSTGVMELVLFLEARFGLRLADEDMTPQNLDSIRNMTQFVERTLAAQSLAAREANREDQP